MSEWKEYLEEQLKDPQFKKEYEILEPEFSIVEAIIEARKNKGISQKQLSELTGIAQGDISKIEKGNANPSLKTIKRLAAGMGMSVKLEFIPNKSQQQNTTNI